MGGNRIIPGPDSTGGANTLQEAYDGAAAIITAGNGAVALSRILTDAISPLTIDKSPAASAAGSALAVSMGSFATGPAVDITHNGSGPELQWGTNKIQGGSVYLAEKAGPLGDTPGLGQIFVQNDSPNTLWFVDDTGVAVQLGQANLASLPGSTYTTLQHMRDTVGSGGDISGGLITDDADGTITVAAGTGLIRATDSTVAEILNTDWLAESGVNVALVDQSINHIYVEYNAGSPQPIATTVSRATDCNTNILLGTVYRNGTTLHISNQGRHRVNDHVIQLLRRLKQVTPFERVSGGIVGETGTRNISVTAGSWWEGLQAFSTTAIDTSVADTIDLVYRDGVGGWTEVLAQTQIDNLQYDDGTGILATLSNNRFGVHWVYTEQDSDVFVLYGRGDYTLIQAQDAGAPADVPPWFEANHARLIGKIIIAKSAGVFTSIESAFDTQFVGSVATDHGNLLGLTGTDHHTQYLLTDGTRTVTGPMAWTSGGASDPSMQSGTVDPSAAAGVAAPEGSLFMRFVATAGEAWVKSGAAATDWTQLGAGGGGGLTPLAVANIDDPSTELNAIAGSANGETRLCYQADANADQWTLYAWDSADASGEAVPHRVDGSSGMWSAIAGKYNSGGINAAADTDTTFVFGRLRLHSASSDFAYLSHFDKSGTTDYGLRLAPDGDQTTVNSSGTTLFQIANANQFRISAGQFFAFNAAGPAILNEASSATNPTLAPDRGNLASGIGGTGGQVSLITAGTEAVTVDTSQNQINAGDISIPQGSSIYFDGSGGNDRISAAADNNLYFFTGGGQRLRLQAASALFSQPVLINDTAVGEASTLVGLAVDNTSAATVSVNQWSPVVRMKGEAWDTTLAATHDVEFMVQNRTFDADPVYGHLTFFADINGAGENTVLEISSDGRVLLTDDGAVSTESSLGFASDSTKIGGMRRNSSNGDITLQGVAGDKLIFGAGNVNVFQISNTLVAGGLRAGSEGAPFYYLNSDITTGFWRPAVNIYALSTAGTEAVRYDASQTQINAGNIELFATGKYGWTGDADTYIQQNAANQMRIVTGGTISLGINGATISAAARIQPTTDKGHSLGGPSNRWNQIDLNRGVVITRDDAAASQPDPYIEITPAAWTNLSPSFEHVCIDFDFAATLTLQGGTSTIAKQSTMQLLAPTWAAVSGTRTITDAATLYINNAPQQGSFVVLTNAWALWVDAGTTRLDGDLDLRGTNLGFYGATPAAKPTITGSRAGNAALADLLTELATLGLITDSSS